MQSEINLDFSLQTSFKINIGDGIPDLSQLKIGIIIVNKKEGQMTWSQLPMNESHSNLVFRHRADLFLDNEKAFRAQVENWTIEDYKKRCAFFLKKKDEYQGKGEIFIENGDVSALHDDSFRRITIIGDHTGMTAKKYGLPESTDGSMGSSGRQFFYENLDADLYNLVKLRMIADELDATWLEDIGARD